LQGQPRVRGARQMLKRLYGLLMRFGFHLGKQSALNVHVRGPGGTLKRRKAPPEGIAGRAGFRPYPGDFRAVRPDALPPRAFLPGRIEICAPGAGEGAFRSGTTRLSDCRGRNLFLLRSISYPQAAGLARGFFSAPMGSELPTRPLRRHLRQLLGALRWRAWITRPTTAVFIKEREVPKTSMKSMMQTATFVSLAATFVSLAAKRR